MKTVKAKVRLATGNVGWYDPLTNIHLTIQRPEGIVYEGMNTSNLKKGVMYKTITVTDGSLSEPSETVIPTNFTEVAKKAKSVEKEIINETKEEVKEIVVEETKELEEVAEETEKVEAIEEDVVEKVEEEKPKKKTSKKKKSE